jgi:hypothetical protein
MAATTQGSVDCMYENEMDQEEVFLLDSNCSVPPYASEAKNM